MLKKRIKWGILGCGGIANSFADGLSVLPEAELVSVASQTPGKAESFACKHRAVNAYSSYRELAQDPLVDVVYVATTHNFHFENTMLLLDHGKAVLCEKPFTINALQTKQLIEKARSKKVFLMEAMWTRFLPLIIEMNKIIDAGTIGEILNLQADFCAVTSTDPMGRMLNPNLGGGALLDLGIYPVSFARMLFKAPPAQIKSFAHMAATGVDIQSSYFFSYPQGQTAFLSSACRIPSPIDARIHGSKGHIVVKNFFHPSTMTITIDNKEETRTIPGESTGYNYEAAHVMECMREGTKESPVMPLDESLEIMETMDALRAQWGMKYPGE